MYWLEEMTEIQVRLVQKAGGKLAQRYRRHRAPRCCSQQLARGVLRGAKVARGWGPDKAVLPLRQLA